MVNFTGQYQWSIPIPVVNTGTDDGLFPGIDNGQYQWSTVPMVNTSGQYQHQWSINTNGFVFTGQEAQLWQMLSLLRQLLRLGGVLPSPLQGYLVQKKLPSPRNPEWATAKDRTASLQGGAVSYEQGASRTTNP